MLDLLNSLAQEGRTWRVNKCFNDIYDIFSTPSVMIDIRKRICTCLIWQNNGFPCSHAAVVLYRFSLPVKNFIEKYFHVDHYRKSYEKLIYPIPSTSVADFDLTKREEVLSPVTKRQPDRSRKKRFRSRGEVVKRIKCGRCEKIGNHNRKTCKEPLL